MWTHYSLWQFFGAAICVLGLLLVLLSDGGLSGGGAASCNLEGCYNFKR